jgi:metalloendopeptidase OMA1, mitochondrial
MRTTASLHPSRARRFGGTIALVLFASLLAATTVLAKSEAAREKQKAREIAEGETTRNEVLSQNKELTGTPSSDVIGRVFQRLVSVPEVAERAFPYEIHLLESDEANAFCTPGGKVFVLSGMTSIARDDEGLWAAVLAHELAHAVRSHGVSQEKKAKGLSLFAKIAGHLGGLAPGLGQLGSVDRVAQAAEIAGKVSTGMTVLNPFLMRKFSRDDEADADAQGMIYMAEAGFDPAAAIRLHKELVARFGDSGPLTTFLRTHPREAVRIDDLEHLLPAARAKAGSVPAIAPAAIVSDAREHSHEN